VNDPLPADAGALMTPRRGHGHRMAAALVLLVSLLAVKGSLDLGLGATTKPGPGLWPFIVSTFTGLVAAMLLVVDDPSTHERWTSRSLRIAVGLCVLAAFIAAFSVIGFVLPATLLMLFWLRVFADEPWRLVVPVAVGTAVGLYVVFVVALGVPFPADLLFGGIA
jgi:putative tricarboxylic transport membrane protein